MIGRFLLYGMFCVALAAPAAADYSGGMAAYRAERYFEAYHHFRSAAEAGEVESQYMLGRLYAEGYGVRRDFVKAYKWFSLAAAAGSDPATVARDGAAARMTPEQLEDAQALAYRWTPSDTRWRVPAPFVFSIRSIQHALNELGYEAGPEDGLMGARTRHAISAYQRDSGLPETGEATEELFDRLRISLWAKDSASAVVGARSGEPDSSARRSFRTAAAPSGTGPNMSEQTARIDGQPSDNAMILRSALHFIENLSSRLFDPAGDSARTRQAP